MLPRQLLYYLLGINLLTFLAYGVDKWKAVRNGSRVPAILVTQTIIVCVMLCK